MTKELLENLRNLECTDICDLFFFVLGYCMAQKEKNQDFFDAVNKWWGDKVDDTV